MGISVLICDDDMLIREGLKMILNQFEEIEVCGTVQNGKEAVEFCKRLEPNVILLDVRMPDMDGVTATKEITEKTKTKVIILTTFDEEEFIVQGIKNGAKGYLLKTTAPEKIVATIEMIHEGHTVFGEEILETMKTMLTSSHATTSWTEVFTERELEIVRCISRGLSNKEISTELFISEGTIKNYISTILLKLGLKHRTQIAIQYLTDHLRK